MNTNGIRHRRSFPRRLAVGLVLCATGAWWTGSAHADPFDFLRGVGEHGNAACDSGNCELGGCRHGECRGGDCRCEGDSCWDRLRCRLERCFDRHHPVETCYPECPPLCHPTYGYYEKCWRRLPDLNRCPPAAYLPSVAPAGEPLGETLPEPGDAPEPPPAPTPEPESTPEPTPEP